MSQNIDDRQQIYDDEITLKELILKIKEFYAEIIKNKFLILLIALPFVLYMTYKSYGAKYSYNAKLTFMVNQSEGGVSGLGSLLGQFGFGNDKELNKTKITQLAKSRNIVEKALLSKVKINENEDILANHLITNLDTNGLWMRIPFYLKPFREESSYKEFRFKNINVDSFDLDELSILKSLYLTIVGGEDAPGGIVNNGFDKESGILNIVSNTSEAELSIELTNKIFDNLSEFYVDKTVEKQKATYDLVKAKSDSLLFLLQSKEAGYSSFEDKNLGIWNQTSALPGKRYSRDIQKLTLMYAESLKNLEFADFALKNTTPFIQPIDRPILPLKGNKASLLKSLITGFLLGIFIGITFVAGRKIYRDAMAD